MFSLDKHNAQITHLNLRAEKHGDDNQPACDINVSVDVPAEGDQLPLVEVGKKPEGGIPKAA